MTPDRHDDSSEACTEIRSLLAAAALGDNELDAPTRAHLVVCPACRRALSEYASLALVFPFSVEDQAPPDALRDRIGAAVRAAAAATHLPEPVSTPLPGSLPARPARRPAYRLWSALAGALAVILALLGWNLSLQRELATRSTQIANSRTNWQTLVVMMNDPDVEVYRLSGDAASGTFWGVPQGNDACLMIEDLPALPTDQAFQVWLNDGAGWVSAGVFQPRPGSAWLFIHPNQPIASYSAVLVTIEPAGGSAAPTGTPQIEGPLGSIRG